MYMSDLEISTINHHSLIPAYLFVVFVVYFCLLVCLFVLLLLLKYNFIVLLCPMREVRVTLPG